jgi:hypothetical protein
LRKSVFAIQEVKVLPRAKVSHRPGSRTRWLEETKVRNRARRVVGVCMEPRNCKCGPIGDKPRGGRLILPDANRGQLCGAGTQQPLGAKASRRGGHRGRRPDHDGKGIARELARASSASCLHRRGPRRAQPVGVPRVTKAPGKGPRSAGPIQPINAETTGTRGRAG